MLSPLASVLEVRRSQRLLGRSDIETPGCRPETTRRLHLLFAVLGTDLGTEHGEFDANKRDVVKQAGRRNAVDLNM